jgi:hypothetical protein
MGDAGFKGRSLSRPEPQRSAKAMPAQASVAIEEANILDTDLRWALAQRIAAGPHFARAPLMSKFLLYVVTETLEGRQTGITEHQIGVRVFGRPAVYRTDEDNIVRNYARQLRKRLAEYFAGEGSREPIRIDIPVGGYVPAFTEVAQQDHSSGVEGMFAIGLGEIDQAGPYNDSNRVARTSRLSEQAARQSTESRVPWMLGNRATLRNVAFVLAYSALLVCLTWLASTRIPSAAPHLEPTHLLWKSLLSGANNTYIVPPDTGLNIVEDISQRVLPLADYIKGSYLEASLEKLDEHTRQDLRTQQFSDFQSLQIVAAIARREEYNPERVFLRFPRDLRMDDLKTANVILIGSVSSNPWASIADRNTNFRIVPKAGMAGAVVVNAKPLQGEESLYESHWNEPLHDTYALIEFVPNLNGKGHLLLLEGLDVAGTQAAAEVLFHPETIDAVLNRAKLPDGSLRSFEILLRTTSIQSNSAGTQIVATRIH